MEQYLKDPKSGHSEGRSDILYSARKMGSGAWGIPHGTDVYRPSKDTSLFSCSLPVIHHEKLNFTDSEHSGKSTDPLEDIELNALGTLLPDDEDELLAGIMDDFDLSELPNQVEDLEDSDLFGSGGGMEMDFDALENLSVGMSNVNLSDGAGANGTGHYALPNGVGTVAGEHPYGEHPSRTLFVRNINSNVDDSELRSLFEQYGDIRTLYTACKHRGFVMISYYDIRAARIAMRALQNKPLRRRKLDIHFSIPKDNPSEKDINQGTLVVFNLDASVSNDELHNIFGAYGEVKEIRETPHKRHHKFIEYYDVRAAEAALKALNRSDIGGKRIKLEPSRPGGARRNLMQQLSQELELDETKSFRHQLGSPVANSPPGMGSFSPVNNYMPGLASILPKIAPIGKDQGRVHNSNPIFSSNGHSHSFPDQKFSSSPGTLTGPQFLWGSPTPYSERTSSSAMGPPLAYTNRHGSIIASHHQHHVGSAPSGVPLDRRFGYFSESPETSYMGQASFGSMGLGHNNGSYMMGMGARPTINGGFGIPRSPAENGSHGYRMMSLPRPGQVFPGNGTFLGPTSIGSEGLAERARNRRVETNEIDSKKQFQLDLDKIVNGEDTRTTLMIKNIPNKYTSKMLLASIDEFCRGTYDFLYLPIDFKNKCNVGYAFINMVAPAHIVPFYQAFNGKKWEKFNSEKVASLAYARIQGKASLITHFQNSSLMNEDKGCRPILFHSEGQEATDQEILLSGNLNICIRQPDGSYSGDPDEKCERS